MAKANSKDAYYFSHDSNARNDEKILAMRSAYGLEGYGMYFMIIEILREQTGYAIEVNKYVYGSLAIQLQSSVKKVEKFINDCVNEFSLLTIKDDFLFSESLLRRMEIVDTVSQKRKNASMTRWNNKNIDANGMQMESKCNPNDMPMESKEKEKIQKENKTEHNTAEIEDFFESVWILYPKRAGKGSVSNKQKKILFDIGYDEIKRCIERYLADQKNPDFYKHGSTFFNTGYIDYLDCNCETNNKIISKKETKPIEEVKSRYDPLTEEERKMFFDRGAFFIDEDGECVDFSELTEEERIYLHKKGVI